MISGNRFSRDSEKAYLESFSEWVDSSRLSPSVHEHSSVLSKRLELESTGSLEGSSLLLTPGDALAAGKAIHQEDAVAASTPATTSVAPATMSLDVSVAGAAGGEEQSVEDGGDSRPESARSKSGRDFKLV